MPSNKEFKAKKDIAFDKERQKLRKRIHELNLIVEAQKKDISTLQTVINSQAKTIDSLNLIIDKMAEMLGEPKQRILESIERCERISKFLDLLQLYKTK